MNNRESRRKTRAKVGARCVPGQRNGYVRNLFGLLVLMSNRHVEANPAGSSLNAFVVCQVNERIVTIQEGLSESRLKCGTQYN